MGILAVIVLAAVALRIQTFQQVFTEHGILFLEYDPYYHMRRIAYSAEYFPNFISFDTYINFPRGHAIGWPPLFDTAIGGVAFILGLGSPSVTLIETVGAVAPVVIGLLLLLPIYYAARVFFGGEEYGLAAAGIAAILPAHVLISLLGFVDHHVMETLLQACMVLGVLLIVRCPEKLTLWSLFLGATFLATIYSIPSALIYIGSIGLFLVAMIILRHIRNHSSRDLLYAGGVAFGSAGVIALIINTLFFEGFVFEPILLSVFQPAFLFLCLGGIAGAALLSDLLSKRPWPWYIATLAGIGGGGAALVYFLFPSVYNAILSGFNYILGADPVFGYIGEAASILYITGSFSRMPFWDLYTVPLFLAVIGSIVYCSKRVKNKTFDDADLMLILLALFGLILVLFQTRFLDLLIVPVVIWASYGAVSLLEALGIRKIGVPEEAEKKKRKKKNRENEESLKMQRAAGVLVALLIIIVPTVHSAAGMNERLPGPPSDEKIGALEFLKSETPSPGGYHDMTMQPDYSVISRWDWGNHIIYIAERPVVSNNFQTAIVESSRFLTTTDIEDAERILDRRNVRYVVTQHLTQGEFTNFLSLGGVDISTLTETEFLDIAGESVYFRLHHEGAKTLPQFTLIYESHDDLTGAKVFEYTGWAQG